MKSKKLVTLLVSVILGLGVAWQLSNSKDENFYYYYPGGFGDGELSEIMEMFYQHAPKTTSATWRVRPVFVLNDSIERKVTTSYGLLTDKTKKDIGIKNEKELLDFISKRSPEMRWRSYVARPKHEGEGFTLIYITKRTDSDFEMDIYHELFHFLDIYPGMVDFNGKKYGFYRKIESRLKEHYGKDIADFEESYSLRHDEQMAFLSSAYKNSTSIDSDTLKMAYVNVLKEDVRHKKVGINVPHLYKLYEQSAIRSFFVGLIKSEARVDYCDFNCLGEMYLSDPKVLDLEFKHLVDNDYFNMGGKNSTHSSTTSPVVSDATL